MNTASGAQPFEDGALVTPAWPAVSWEDVLWQPKIPMNLLPRSARERQASPYRASVAPQISQLDPRLPRAVLAAADEASVMIREFDEDVGREVAPFGAVLLRSESASSSQIEDLTSGAKQLALAEIGEDARRNATAIVGNVRAMRAAIELSETVVAGSILAMHHALLDGAAPEIAGQWRKEQVWIGGGPYSPHDAAFVPPRAELIPDGIEDLVRFAGRDDIPALIHSAIAHAQFETIHPFVDGNGRTGRALIHALLRRRGLTRSVTIPVSAGLLVDTSAYFRALTAYRAGDVVPIVEAMSDAAVLSIANGRMLVEELRGIKERWREETTARSDSAVWALMDLVLRQPVITTAVVRAELGIAHTNAMRAIRHLVDAGVLTEVGGRRRSVLWQSTEVLTALDAFADRAGRRTFGRVG